MENHESLQEEGMELVRTCIGKEYILQIEYSGKDILYRRGEMSENPENLIYEETLNKTRNQLHEYILQWMNDTMDPFRGYYWDVRNWRKDKTAKWDMMREAVIPIDERDYEELDYFTGLPYGAEHPDIQFSLDIYYKTLAEREQKGMKGEK